MLGFQADGKLKTEILDRSLTMITRRDFAKLAGFAAGSIAVSSRGETQEKQSPAATGNPAAVASGFVQRPGAEIYYERAGSGPAIVFAHGLGGNHLSWWQQVPYFSQHYTCIAFAHRGFSPSRITSGSVDPALFEEALLALVDKLELTDVQLVAQPMGGWTCLNFALRHPRRVRAWSWHPREVRLIWAHSTQLTARALKPGLQRTVGLRLSFARGPFIRPPENGWRASNLLWNSCIGK